MIEKVNSAPSAGASSARGDRRRKALTDALREANMTAAEVSRLAGFKNANIIYNHLAGRSDSLSAETYEKLARVIPGTTAAKLQGLNEGPKSSALGMRPIIVVMLAQAEVWRDTAKLPPKSQFEASCPLSLEQLGRDPFGVLVRGLGADRLYADGTILVCQSMQAEGSAMAKGRRYVVQRQRGREIEIGVRELQVSGDSAWLIARTSDEELAAPVRLPWPWPDRPWRVDTEVFTVLGQVIMACAPEGAD